MTMLPSLRNELHKYSKRGGGMQPRGISRGRIQIPEYAGAVQSYGPRRDHRLYGWDNKDEYQPRLNAPAVQNQEYETYCNWDLDLPGADNEMPLFKPFPELKEKEEEPKLSWESIYDKFFLDWLEESYQKEPVSVDRFIKEPSVEAFAPKTEDSVNGILDPDNLPEFNDVMDAWRQLHKVLPSDHQDIQNLRQAFHEFLDHEEWCPQPEYFGVSGQSRHRLGVDPYMDDDLPYEPMPMQIPGHLAPYLPAADLGGSGLESVLSQPEGETYAEMSGLEQVIDEGQAMPEMTGTPGPDAFESFGLGGLTYAEPENPAGPMMDTAAQEIEQAIDQAIGLPMDQSMQMQQEQMELEEMQEMMPAPGSMFFGGFGPPEMMPGPM